MITDPGVKKTWVHIPILELASIVMLAALSLMDIKG
jgi:hypothetical protein